VKHLYEQQQRLQAATSRIEKVLDEMKQSGHVDQEASGVKKFHIPRHLSVSINYKTDHTDMHTYSLYTYIHAHFTHTLTLCILQAIVHDAYRHIIDDDENEIEWDFSTK